MSDHRFILEPYKGMKTRYQCPSCEHREKSFTRYIDMATKEYLNANVGRCNRENNCGYHYTPKQYFQDHNNSRDKVLTSNYRQQRPIQIIEKPKAPSFIQDTVFRSSLSAYDNNHFISFLIARFGIELATQVTKRYLIGSSKHWEGSTVFWQIDIEGRVRTGKIILYNSVTGKRVKEPRICINWVHSVLKAPGFNLNQVLFGEHLLRDKSKPCALVESEKSAIIASLYFPQFIWLATGSLTNLSEDLCKVLKGRNVILFPDLKGYDKWKAKASEIKSLAGHSISDLLERKATESEKQSGLDIADYLLKLDPIEFSNEINNTEQIRINLATNSVIDLPFDKTLLGQKFMFEMADKYFSKPLFPKLIKEKPFTDAWNDIYLQIRNFSKHQSLTN